MFYQAIVEDNKDPDKCKRVKVRIFGIHTSKTSGEFEGIDTSNLPWAEVMGGTDFGLVGGVGVSSVLRQGTMVWVFFRNDDPNYPVVIGTVAGVNTSKTPYGSGFCDPDGIHPKRMGSDLHPSAQGSYGSLATIETQSGHLIELDDSSGNERVKVTHKSGSYIEIAPDGTIKINSVANMEHNIAGDYKLNVTGNISTQSGGENKVQAGGNYGVTAARIDLN